MVCIPMVCMEESAGTPWKYTVFVSIVYQVVYSCIITTYRR